MPKANPDWAETIPAIAVAIKNTKSVVYLVDVFCLGLKNVIYRIDTNENETQDFVEMYPEDFTEIDYEEARGIIIGAIAYADDLSFEPHEDWQKVKGFIEAEKPYETKHEFGKNGKPFYVGGPDDDMECFKWRSFLQKGIK